MARSDQEPDRAAHVTLEDVRRLCEFIYRRTGMLFAEDKRYFIDRRLDERIAATGARSFQAYFALLRSDQDSEIEHLVNAFTVNETYFFREDHQLRCMTSHLMGAILRNKRASEPVRIWSMPCSTGEEPYSIAHLADGALPRGRRPDPAGIDGHFTAVFDAHGAPVWWMRRDDGTPAYDARLVPGDGIVWAGHDNGEYPYVFRALDGTVTRTLRTAGTPTDLHDIQALPGGNYLMLSYPTREPVDLSPYGGPSDALVLDADVQEVTPSGQLVWSWNSKDHIDLAETGRWYGEQVIDRPQLLPDGRHAYDLVHINSVSSRTATASSCRCATRTPSTGSGARTERSTGSGGTTTPESLTVEGDDHAEPLGGQHDARALPSGHVSIHDNATGLGRAPRAVVYRIDPVAGTATLVEEVTDSRAPSSFCCGSSRRLSGGNWVMGWGARSLMTGADGLRRAAPDDRVSGGRLQLPRCSGRAGRRGGRGPARRHELPQYPR